MGESLKPIGPASRSQRVSEEEDQSTAYREPVGREGEERRRPRQVDEHSESARTDEVAWNAYFCNLISAMFLLFQSQEMYEKYIFLEKKALDWEIRVEREDARMRDRWDNLTSAFHQEFERVLRKSDDLKHDNNRRRVAEGERKAKVETRVEKEAPMPFESRWISDPDGLDVKVARVFYRTEPSVPRLRRRSSGMDEIRGRVIVWLYINRRTRRISKRDDEEKLAEAA